MDQGHEGEVNSYPMEKQPAPEIDLDTAKIILKAIIDTDESSFTEDSPIDQINGYSTDQIRKAVSMVATSIILQAGEPITPTSPHISKITPQGTAHLFSDKDSVSMSLMEGDQDNGYRCLLKNDFAIVEPDTPFWKSQTGFDDYRSKRPQRARLDFLQVKPSLAGFQHMVRGLRWMSANILTWDKPDIIMPEQLDHRPELPATPSS